MRPRYQCEGIRELFSRAEGLIKKTKKKFDFYGLLGVNLHREAFFIWPFMNKRKIVAIVGLPGCGKTEAINYLIEKLGWPKIYLGDATFEEMQRRALPINEKNERLVREELREKNGPACYALWGIEKIKELDKTANILVESLYSWGEYLEFKKIFGEDFLTIAIYSSPCDRYARLAKRPVRPLTPEEAQSRDYSQIASLVAQAGPIAMADWTITNNTSRENLFLQLDKIIEVLKK